MKTTARTPGPFHTPEDPSSCSFTYAHYKYMLAKALSHGYEVMRALDFVEKRPEGDKVIVLTHDIDLSVQKALKMAKLEKEMGVRSTFFVRISGLYNILDTENLKALKTMLGWGHEIGLHFSLEHYLYAGQDVVEAISSEKELLEKALDTTVQGFSLHSTLRLTRLCGESLDEIRMKLLSGGFRYCRGLLIKEANLRFISDSNRYWRDGCLCRFLGQEPRIIALIHPFWWDEEDLPVITLIEKAIRGEIL